jgi:predicted ATPase with chaperone activity
MSTSIGSTRDDVAQGPKAPETLADTGLSGEAVTDLIFKILYVQGAQSGMQIAQTIRLPFDIVDAQLLQLQSRRFIEVIRTFGPSRGNYVFDLAGAGRDRAKAALESSQYVGAAPVPLKVYREWIEKQSVRGLRVGRQHIRDGFGHLVIEEEILEALGPAVNSASSLFLYGEPGNGKTVIAEAIAAMLGCASPFSRRSRSRG